MFGDIFSLYFAKFKLLAIIVILIAAFGYVTWQRMTIESLRGENEILKAELELCQAESSAFALESTIKDANIKTIIEYCENVKALDMKGGTVPPEVIDELMDKNRRR